MALHQENNRPWWRRVDIAEARRDVALLSESDELLYYRFLLAYTEHRCELPADPAVLAKVLATTEKRAASFLKAAAKFLTVDSSGVIHHESSRRDFHKAVAESRAQANRRAGK